MPEYHWPRHKSRTAEEQEESRAVQSPSLSSSTEATWDKFYITEVDR